MRYPFVSVIIPCRNEEQLISHCIDSLVLQDYPFDRFEVLVIDGMSSDRTRDIIFDCKKKYQSLFYHENKKRITPSAFNIGIHHARGSTIIFMGAHAAYRPDYITRCIETLQKCNADVVGGVLETKPSKNTFAARAIAAVLSHPFGAGNARFRIGSDTPREVDTVFGGCYQKEIFDRVGLFNEHLVRSQDIEMNIRIRCNGGKIILDPSIVCTYYPKSTLHTFFKHNITDGIWAIYPLKFVLPPLRLRHYIPLLFILCLLILGINATISSTILLVFVIILSVYGIITVTASMLIAIKKKDLRLIPFLFLSFFARHFGYGIGSLIGCVKLFLPVKNTYGTTKAKRN